MAQRISRLQVARNILLATIGCACMSSSVLAESTIQPISTKVKRQSTFPTSNLSFDNGGNLVRLTSSSQVCAPSGCVTPGYQLDNLGNPNAGMPGTYGVDPSTGAPITNQPGVNQPGMNQPGVGDPAAQAAAPMFSEPGAGALGTSNFVAAADSPGGYLDMAAPITQFRLRYDDAMNNQTPDRGEYFYAQCGCFRIPAALGGAGDGDAKGPPGANVTSVDYQAIRAYAEYAFSPKFSVFAELPYQFVHFNTADTNMVPPNVPDATAPSNPSGIADMNAGFKYALIANPWEYLTFQLRTYIPTGNSYLGLGNSHVSFESGLLYYKRLSERWILQAEFKEFAPVGVSGYASNVLQYGGGLGYRLYQGERMVVTPTFETVGWTFLGGQKLTSDGMLESASGDTIVNIKPGVRVGLSDLDAPSGQQRHSVYFGWGHAVTDQALYQDIYRVEYRVLF